MGSCVAALWVRRERGKREGRRARGSEGGSVWVILALDVYENFLKGRKRSQAVAGGGLPPYSFCVNHSFAGRYIATTITKSMHKQGDFLLSPHERISLIFDIYFVPHYIAFLDVLS